MSVRAYRDITRRKSRKIRVGSAEVGGDAPISVQSMTNTITADAARPSRRCVRWKRPAPISCACRVRTRNQPTALKAIVRAAQVPIVADIHFHYKRAIEAAEAGAACLRINPGNIGSAQRVREVVAAAKDHGCSMRIGVNAGSLEKELLERYGEPCPEAMVESALNHARILEDNDFTEFKISVKASDVFLAVAAYQGLADACDYPLHLGITEAGGLMSGTVKSSIGMGMLLWCGNRRHDPRLAVRRSGRRNPRGLRHSEVAGPAASRREYRFVSVLRAAGFQCDRDGANARGTSEAYLDSNDAFDHRLRRQRTGRSARD